MGTSNCLGELTRQFTAGAYSEGGGPIAICQGRARDQLLVKRRGALRQNGEIGGLAAEPRRRPPVTFRPDRVE